MEAWVLVFWSSWAGASMMRGTRFFKGQWQQLVLIVITCSLRGNPQGVPEKLLPLPYTTHKMAHRRGQVSKIIFSVEGESANAGDVRLSVYQNISARYFQTHHVRRVHLPPLLWRKSGRHYTCVLYTVRLAC